MSRARDAAGLAPRLLRWHAKHGRHDLPWQKRRTAYRVWISEIMLQQTQVATVIPYFTRFLQRFPTVRALADAPLDDVLHLWAGLGYYARARNLHRAAQRVRDEHGGRFPRTFEAVSDMPGIGRSTAGAILALAHNQRWPILDGNVKRVLARYYAIDGAPDDRAVVEALWEIADRETPASDPATYTQAIMDLGATVCTRAKPVCTACPLASDCRAKRDGRQAELPARKRSRAARRTRRVYMLLGMRHEREVLLVQRPLSGIWGGLWCPPEFEEHTALAAFARANLADAVLAGEPLEPIEHTFTHFDLVITPWVARCAGLATRVADFAGAAAWYDLAQTPALGLPAPVKTLLGGLRYPSAP